MNAPLFRETASVCRADALPDPPRNRPQYIASAEEATISAWLALRFAVNWKPRLVGKRPVTKLRCARCGGLIGRIVNVGDAVVFGPVDEVGVVNEFALLGVAPGTTSDRVNELRAVTRPITALSCPRHGDRSTADLRCRFSDLGSTPRVPASFKL